MKKFLILILSLICFSSTISLTGCNNHIEPFTIMPTQKTKITDDSFIASFHLNAYIRDDVEYVGFYNYLPLNITQKYGVLAFEAVHKYDWNTNLFSDLYVSYNGKFFMIAGMDVLDEDEGFNNFAITDFNNDGFLNLFALSINIILPQIYLY